MGVATQWCAICLDEDDRRAASTIIAEVPLCPACESQYGADAEMLAHYRPTKRSIQSIGGQARAESLSADDRSRIAANAAETRWNTAKEISMKVNEKLLDKMWMTLTVKEKKTALELCFKTSEIEQ